MKQRLTACKILSDASIPNALKPAVACGNIYTVIKQPQLI
jgi:hypothetical protein